MNPHKLIDAYQPTENLRLGADYNPAQPVTFFSFPDDKGSFAKAAHALHRPRRVPEARLRHDVPELHGDARRGAQHARPRASPVGDAAGRSHQGSWKSEEVKESLDLCLSCKACKSECPTNVDIATYRAEFLAHYYETRRRPLAAYAFGLIDRWAALGADAPRLANLMMKTPGVTALVKQALGLASQRAMPQLAPRSFAKWARATNVPAPGERSDESEAGSHSLGGHVQQLFPSRHQPGSARCAASRRAPRHRAGRAAVLRPAAVRFRHARSREAVSAAA